MLLDREIITEECATGTRLVGIFPCKKLAYRKMRESRWGECLQWRDFYLSVGRARYKESNGTKQQLFYPGQKIQPSNLQQKTMVLKKTDIDMFLLTVGSLCYTQSLDNILASFMDKSEHLVFQYVASILYPLVEQDWRHEPEVLKKAGISDTWVKEIVEKHANSTEFELFMGLRDNLDVLWKEQNGEV